MKQTDLGLNLTTKRTRKREFLDEMERVLPWPELVALITPYAPEGKRGRPPFAVEAMLRIHFMQQWFTLSDPAMEEALHDIALFREFAGLNWDGALPDETTILRFRRLLEQHKLGPQILRVVNDWRQARPGDDAEQEGPAVVLWDEGPYRCGCRFRARAYGAGTSGNVNDVVEANSLLHSQESEVFADAGYRGAHNRPDARPGVRWSIAMRPGKQAVLDKTQLIDRLLDQIEHIKASIRAKAEHPFRVIKRQFGHTKVRYRGLAKNTAQLHTLFALANLVIAKKALLAHRPV
jgi:transposase, IS5 family